jgi:hypothetical protein
LALFAFVIGDAIGSNNGGGARQDIVGVINGEDVGREEFSQVLEAYKSRSNGRASDMQTLNTVWDGFVRERVFKQHLNLAGIVVGENDVWESLVSNPNFQSDPSFQNEVGLFDEEIVKEYIANLREDAIDAPANSDEKSMWNSWLNYESRVRQSVIQSSYTNLVGVIRTLGNLSIKDGEKDSFLIATTFDKFHV